MKKFCSQVSLELISVIIAFFLLTTCCKSTSSDSTYVKSANVGQGGFVPRNSKNRSAKPKRIRSERDHEDNLFRLANQERKKRKTHVLKRSKKLDKIAKKYCIEMSKTGEYEHNSPISGTPGDRATAAGFSFARLSENLAKTPDSNLAHNGFMKSPGHRANILDKRMDLMGIGVLEIDDKGQKSIITVELFAVVPQKIKPKSFEKKLVGQLNSKRSRARLKRLKVLDKYAAASASNCFKKSKKLAAPSLRHKNIKEAKTIGFYLAGIAGIDSILSDGHDDDLLDSDYTFIGVSVSQGDHKRLGKDVVCVRIVLGK